MFDSFRGAVIRARLHGDLYFAALLDEQHILEAFGPARSFWQGWLYTPAVTTWVFLSQCLSPDHSCRDAVSRLSAWQLAQGRRPCSPDTGAYCAARDALPEPACRQLVRDTGRESEAQSPAEWLWHGRRVRVVDGSTITMPDTPENQAEYPQAKTQKPGCGLPHRADPGHLLVGHGARCWRRPSADTKGRRPERTACFARCTTCWKPATSRWPTAISAAGLTSRCSGSAAWMRCCANIKSELPTSARASVWDPTITSCRQAQTGTSEVDADRTVRGVAR